MIIPANSTRTRRFQPQLIPAYIGGELDFGYDLTLKAPGDNVEFGLKSSDGTVRAKYNLRSGLVYDYSGRFVSTYQSGDNFFQYGLKGSSNYTAFQRFNNRLISLQDPFANYAAKPFDRFYVTNNGAGAVEVDLQVRGFAPPTIYSDLLPMGDGYYSGNLTQSGFGANPSGGVPYALLEVGIGQEYGVFVTGGSEATGTVSYILKGDFANGQRIPLSFTTLYGKVYQDVTVVAPGSTTTTTTASVPEVGLQLAVHGEPDALTPGGSRDFVIDYYSNAAHDIDIQLTTADATATAAVSGEGVGYLDYTGYIKRAGLLYSAPFATGLVDLKSSANSIYNTSILTSLESNNGHVFVELKQAAPARTLQTNYIGKTRFVITGVPLTGIYDGPNPGLKGYRFRGLGDMIISDLEFEEGNNGVIEYNDKFVIGHLNPGYSPTFEVDRVTSGPFGGGVTYSTANAAVFPATSAASGKLTRALTGEGIMTLSKLQDNFFGTGVAKLLKGQRKLTATGVGKVTYAGNAYDWDLMDVDVPAITSASEKPAEKGAPHTMRSVKGRGRLTASNGEEFYAEGVPNPVHSTWGYPEGPSKIVVGPTDVSVAVTTTQTITVPGWKFHTPQVGSEGANPAALSGQSGHAGGWWRKENIDIPAGGYYRGVAKHPGGVFQGPVFPEAGEIALAAYVGEGDLKSTSGVKYGRGCIFTEYQEGDTTPEGLFLMAPPDSPYKMVFTYTGNGEKAVVEYQLPLSAPGIVPLDIVRPGNKLPSGVPAGPGDPTEPAAYLLFDDPVSERDLTESFTGEGYVADNAAAGRFQLFYTETAEAFPETPSTVTPISNGLALATKQYPSKHKKGYVRIKSESASDPGSLQTAKLKITAKRAGVNDVFVETDLTTNVP